MLQVKQGFEPPTFTGHFLAWDYDMWSVCLKTDKIFIIA